MPLGGSILKQRMLAALIHLHDAVISGSQHYFANSLGLAEDIMTSKLAGWLVGLVLSWSAVGAQAQQDVNHMVASVLPNSRSAVVGEPATVFASVLSANAELSNCAVSLADATEPYTLSYQKTDAGNVPIGNPDEPFSVPLNGAQSLVLAFTPTSASAGHQVLLNYTCNNGQYSAPVVVGVNTVYLRATDTAAPDIIPILATSSGDGKMSFAFRGDALAAGAAAVNIGPATGVEVTAVAPFLPSSVHLQVCETNPSTGACVQAIGNSAYAEFAKDEVKTFSVFAIANIDNGIPDLPAVSRIYLLFQDRGLPTDKPEAGGKAGPAGIFPDDPPVIGSSSVAASSPLQAVDDGPLGVYRGIIAGQPGFMIIKGTNEVVAGDTASPAKGFVGSANFPVNQRISTTGTGYVDGEYLPSAGIGFMAFQYEPHGYIDGQWHHIDGDPYMYTTMIWDPISISPVFTDGHLSGTSWDIQYDGQSIGSMSIGATEGISGSIRWPVAGGADALTCDLGGATNAAYALNGLNLIGMSFNTTPCGPNMFFDAYADDSSGNVIMKGHAYKAGSNDGTQDFLYLELVQQ